MTSIYDVTIDQLKETLVAYGADTFRAKQVWTWLYQKRVDHFSEMRNLPKSLRDQLARNFLMAPMTIHQVAKSQDGTHKILFRAADAHLFEAVIIPTKHRNTLCVSSQIGCALGCTFCATGTMGLKRNLSVAEIVAQVLLAEKSYGGPVSNLVFMGMGEPLMNYQNVLDAIIILNDKDGLHIGARKITISTSGLADKIIRLASFPLQIRLSISLHAVDDRTRDKIMPINQKVPLKKLFLAIQSYVKTSSRKVTFEYILIRDVNDRDSDAKGLIALARFVCHSINIIPYNPIGNMALKRPTSKTIRRFCGLLKTAGISATVRTQRGADIDAACGQLALKQWDHAWQDVKETPQRCCDE